MTIQVTFSSGDVMLFGDSYKSWAAQLREYCVSNNLRATGFRKSKEPWVAFGGLKWCSPSELQGELDAEGKGRKATRFRFDGFLSDRDRKLWDANRPYPV